MGFESLRANIGNIAQLVEHCTEDAGVSSSSLLISTKDFVAQLVELFTFNEEVLGSSPNGITHRVIEESGLSRFVWDEEHVGSNPTYPTHWNIAQLVRAPL